MSFDLAPEQIDLVERARGLAQGVVARNAAATDRDEAYPWENVRALVDAGFMGMTIPERLGGGGRSFLDASLVVEEMAALCGPTGRIVVEGNMGAIAAVMEYGSAKQQRIAADLVLAGDKPAICITEPEAGSAAGEMTTFARRVGGKWIVNGRKHWITGGGVSRLYLVFARALDRHGDEQGIGGFLAVAGETPGLRIGAREPTMGLRGIPETEVIMEDMEVADDMVLMPPSGFRRGFAELMNAYNSQRVGAGTVALGLAAGAYRNALDFSRERTQFGRPIAEFQGLQWMLADMSIQVEAARALLRRAAASAGSGGSPFPDPTLAAQAKIFASEMAISVTTDALQVFGARGYSRNYPMERLARDARMFTIGGGTAQILRNVVASRLLGQKLPQTRDGYLELERRRKPGPAERDAAD